MISIMVCPLKKLDTSALSVSPRRLTEGVLEGEGPTSADAGVASCLLFDTETEFRRLRDDFWGCVGLGGWHEASWWDRAAKKGVRGKLSGNWSYIGTVGQFSTILNGKSFFATTTKRLDLNIYIVGAGA